MLQGPEQPQIGVLIEERHGGEPWILENGHEWAIMFDIDRIRKPHQGDKRSTQGVYNHGEVLLTSKIPQCIGKWAEPPGCADGSGDCFALRGGIWKNPPGCLIRWNR